MEFIIGKRDKIQGEQCSEFCFSKIIQFNGTDQISGGDEGEKVVGYLDQGHPEYIPFQFTVQIPDHRFYHAQFLEIYNYNGANISWRSLQNDSGTRIIGRITESTLALRKFFQPIKQIKIIIVQK